MINETEKIPAQKERLLVFFFGKHSNDSVSILKTDVVIFNRQNPSSMTTRGTVLLKLIRTLQNEMSCYSCYGAFKGSPKRNIYVYVLWPFW